MILLKLFWSFFQIGLFSIGGGMAAIPLIQNQVVSINGWLTLTEFTDLVTIAEMTPGPIGINSATFVGIRIAGLPGAIAATAGCVLPSCIIAAILAWVYYRFKNLAVAQGSFGCKTRNSSLDSLCRSYYSYTRYLREGGFKADIKEINFVSVLIFVSSLFVLRKWKVNPVFVMLGAGIIGGAIYMFC